MISKAYERTAFCLIFLSLIVIVIYACGMDIQYYSDDFKFVFKPLPSNNLYFSSNQNQKNTHIYRSIEASLLQFIQTHWDLNTFSAHLISIITILTK